MDPTEQLPIGVAAEDVKHAQGLRAETCGRGAGFSGAVHATGMLAVAGELSDSPTKVAISRCPYELRGGTQRQNLSRHGEGGMTAAQQALVVPEPGQLIAECGGHLQRGAAPCRQDLTRT